MDIVQACWAHDPAQRPSFDELVTRLDEVRKSRALQFSATWKRKLSAMSFASPRFQLGRKVHQRGTSLRERKVSLKALGSFFKNLKPRATSSTTAPPAHLVSPSVQAPPSLFDAGGASLEVAHAFGADDLSPLRNSETANPMHGGGDDSGGSSPSRARQSKRLPKVSTAMSLLREGKGTRAGTRLGKMSVV